MLRTTFITLVSTATAHPEKGEAFWNELSNKYGSSRRHYHNLDHLSALIEELQPCRSIVADWEILLFSVFYHDAVYNVLMHNNEEKSAALAAERLTELGIDPARVERCRQQILATKSHDDHGDNDTLLLTDADLSILGKDAAAYQTYTQQIRKEYAIYPDIVYKPGRKKVLRHFLQMDRIYKTTLFRDKYEARARINLRQELDMLL